MTQHYDLFSELDRARRRQILRLVAVWLLVGSSATMAICAAWVAFSLHTYVVDCAPPKGEGQ